MKRKGVGSVTITGGEPLLSEYVYNYIQIAAENNIKVELLINGTIPIENTILDKIDSIPFSIDGSKDIMYKQRSITDKQFEIIIENIMACKRNNIKVKLNSVITKWNINSFTNELLPYIKMIKDVLVVWRVHAVCVDDRNISLTNHEMGDMIKNILGAIHNNKLDVRITTNLCKPSDVGKFIETDTYRYPAWFDMTESIFFIIRSIPYQTLQDLINNYCTDNSVILGNFYEKIKEEKGYINMATGVVL